MKYQCLKMEKNKLICYLIFLTVALASISFYSQNHIHSYSNINKLESSPNEIRLRRERDESSLKLNQLMEAYQQLICKTNNQAGISKTGGWCSHTVESQHKTDTNLAKALAELFGDKTVTGLGDGLGEYRRILLNAGVSKYDAYDGAPDIKNLTGGKVNFLDLTLVQYWLPKTDWVVCLEVLEHIAKEHESTALDNLVRAASIGIVLSWAVPGQDGQNHINCQPPQYVHDVMKQRQFIEDESSSKKLRESAVLWWLKQNAMVFRRYSSQSPQIIK